MQAFSAHAKKKAAVTAAFFKKNAILSFFNRVRRTYLNTGAALYAFVLVDFINITSFADCIFRTLFSTSTTSYTFISNYVHSFLHFKVPSPAVHATIGTVFKAARKKRPVNLALKIK